jgi:creatinine amidohydrolase/Fe(II)-dependent formamide hydrolase-like protein
MHIRLDQCTSDEVKHLLQDQNHKWGLVLPVGCTEQHGPYLPLGCDTAIARKAAESLSLNLHKNAHYKALVLPDFSYTPSPGAEWTAGTVSVNFDFLGKGLSEILNGAMRTPWHFITILNGHGHNHGRCIETSMAGANGTYGKKVPVVVINIYDFFDKIDHIGLDCGSHAGEFEIALYHYYYKEYKFKESKINKSNLKLRPPNIFGLDIKKRSFEGIISKDVPVLSRALENSDKVGPLIDENIKKTLIDNLDIYFNNW